MEEQIQSRETKRNKDANLYTNVEQNKNIQKSIKDLKNSTRDVQYSALWKYIEATWYRVYKYWDSKRIEDLIKKS
jgi:hypothetical protein